ncbi:MAG: hypothetical protein ABMB14_17885 [Myxococcota bacterium]
MLPPFCDDYPGFYYDTAVARGTRSAWLDEDYDGYSGDWTYNDVMSDPFVVTHTLLSWGQIPSVGGSLYVPGFVFGAAVAGPASTDAFTNRQRDVTAACGATVRLTVGSGYGSPYQYDDITLGGAVCPAFLDADGDGWCPRGTDLDADGDCAAADEIDLDVDCDDTDAAVGACLVMSFRPWIAVGKPHGFHLSGATPGDTVYVVGAVDLGRTCPPSLGGACVDLADPVVLGSAVVDPSGEATVIGAIPRRTPYQSIHVQAVTTGLARSAPATGWLVPAAGVPVTDRGVPNGSIEQGTLSMSSGGPTLAWGGDSRGYDMGYGDTHVSCPAPVAVATPAHGTTALSVGSADDFTAELCPGLAHSWPFRVTRTALGWSATGGIVRAYRADTGAAVPLAIQGPVPGSGGLADYGADLSAACGAEVQLDLATTVASPVVFDDLSLQGPPCPQFVDPDGDGHCDDGVDLDGDGACISDGEPTPIAYTVEVPVAHPLLDFEDGFAQPTWTAAETAPLPVWGSASGVIEPNIGFGWFDLGREEIVTHASLVYRVTGLGRGDWSGATLDVYPSYQGNGVRTLGSIEIPGGPGAWAQVTRDLSGSCGSKIDAIEASLFESRWQWDIDSEPYYFDNPDWVLLDDVGFGGDPCPQFVDTDGDGACAEGTDLDADGLCVSAGEPTPGVIVDPDE